MITIYAEKPDVGMKIAAALDKITLASGKTVTYEALAANEKAIKRQQFQDGFLKINYAGEECYVTWGYGHLCGLKEAQDYNPDYKDWSKMPKPFIPDEYEIKVNPNVKKQFNLVSDFFRKSRMLINATDFDREGELIFYYVYKASRVNTPFKRVKLQSQTKEGFVDAFDHLIDSKDVMCITNAGRARSIADADIGYNLTAQLTLKTKAHEVMSAGRVQTAVLAMLVERELAIRNFVPEPYFTISAEFKTSAGEIYKGDHTTKKFKTNAEAKLIFDKIKGKPGVITNIETTLTHKDVPNLHSLSSLQIAASKKYGFTLQHTLNIAQELYEAGYTTYPRTDSQYLTEDMEPVINEVLDVLAKNNPTYNGFITGKGTVTKTKKFFDDSKVVSHFAIIPTKVYPKSLTPDQEKIYDIVARSVIMMLYKSAAIENTKLTTTVDGEEFISNGKTIKDAQWLTIEPEAKDKILPNLAKGDSVTGEYKLNEKQTEPPKRYTDKTILSAMLNAGKELDDETLKKAMADMDIQGIGTEATRAGIVETLVTRKYATRDKKNIFPTERGIQFIQILPIQEIKSAELTAIWEQRLNDIALGKESFEHFISDIEDLTRKWVKELDEKIKEGSVSTREVVGPCPCCKKDIIKLKWGYGCTGYEDGCKFTIPATIASKTLSEKVVKELLTKGTTGTIKGFKSKAGKSFEAKLKIEGDGVVFDFGPKTETPEPSETEIICPTCGNKLTNTGFAYKCDCGFSISSKVASRDISESEITDLITKHETDVLEGFKSRVGKPFAAKLKLNSDNKIEFEFAESKKEPTTCEFNCPDCKKPMVETPWAYKCDCGLNVSKKIASKELTKTQLNSLFTKGKTGKISGFISSKGKSFDAVLEIKDKKVNFKFD